MISNISDSYEQNIQTEISFQFNLILFILFQITTAIASMFIS